MAFSRNIRKMHWFGYCLMLQSRQCFRWFLSSRFQHEPKINQKNQPFEISEAQNNASQCDVINCQLSAMYVCSRKLHSGGRGHLKPYFNRLRRMYHLKSIKIFLKEEIGFRTNTWQAANSRGCFSLVVEQRKATTWIFHFSRDKPSWWWLYDPTAQPPVSHANASTRFFVVFKSQYLRFQRIVALAVAFPWSGILHRL